MLTRSEYRTSAFLSHLYISVIIFIIVTPIYAAMGTYDMGIGYPYICARYSSDSILVPEVRFAVGDGIKAISGRGYYRFVRKGKVIPFTGMEAGYITFDTSDIEGTGYEGSLFLGGEYYISGELSFSLDIAPTYISLQEKSTEIVHSGIEWITSLIVYFHF